MKDNDLRELRRAIEQATRHAKQAETWALHAHSSKDESYAWRAKQEASQAQTELGKAEQILRTLERR